ncbi:MAG: DUF1573 domain-containing protein [Bacteroidia bacterium]|nr:DUF1573 domain-containing protein [Bacteroidia bacterium]
MGVTAQVNTPATPKPSNADIKFEKNSHDYGTVKYGADASYEFKFTNTGTEPLVINACERSCGCTTPTCPKEPILPGKSSIVKVSYDTKRPGPINKTVTIKSNAKCGEVKITITGTVEAQPVEEPFPTEKKENNGTPLAK